MLRFWTILFLIVFIVGGITYSVNLVDKVSFNPLGSFMEPKITSDNDDGIREYTEIINEVEPEWGTMNFGSLGALKEVTFNENGTEGHSVGDSDAIYDMSQNAKVESQVVASPTGMEIHVLPGKQPDGTNLNSFVFKIKDHGALMAPRNYYYQTQTVSAVTSKAGVISKGVVTKEMKQFGAEDQATSSIAVFQVPYGDRFMVSDTTGLTTEAGESNQIASAINKTLTELEKAATSNAGSDKLTALLFKDKGLTTEFNNVNNLINNGKYAKAYKNGLATALGTGDNKSKILPAVKIKTGIANNDVYGQFDFIYDYMKNKKGSKVYSPVVVDWASKNADSILNLLMVNYNLQRQFQGTGGSYNVPAMLNRWSETNWKFYNDFKTKGRSTKEPFYLYGTIDKTYATGIKSTTTPNIPADKMHVDLSYVFGLYTAIQAQVWIGANGANMDGATSQIWQDTVADMSKAMGKKPVSGSNLPSNANKVFDTISNYSSNNLVSGLSSTDWFSKDRTKSVYGNLELIGALRTLLSSGENGDSSNVILNGKKHAVTKIGDTKFTKDGEVSQLYRAFAYGSGDSFSKWYNLVTASANLPIRPVVFRSHWGNNQAAYIMMPVMLGGKEFPLAIKYITSELLTSTVDGRTFDTLSYANRYIMAFNFKADGTATNTKGAKELVAGSKMGVARNTSLPIVLTGYNGSESFNIVDYFKAQDSLKSGRDKPGVQAKTSTGKKIELDYLGLLQDFFSAPVDTRLTGKGETVSYVSGFNKQGYIDKYKPEKNRLYIRRTSPDFTTFFSELAKPAE